MAKSKELLDHPHSIIRHPNMPLNAFLPEYTIITALFATAIGGSIYVSLLLIIYNFPRREIKNPIHDAYTTATNLAKGFLKIDLPLTVTIKWTRFTKPYTLC